MRMDPPRGPDVATMLVRTLREQALAAGCTIHLVAIEGRPWASATFTGMQHRLTIAAVAVPGLRSWIAGLPEAEFTMRGHIVADLVVDHIETVDGHEQVTIAVLTLIDA